MVMLHLHPALCILAGGIVFVGITMLCMSEKWFRILEWSSMLICGYLARFIVHDISGGDRLWTWFAGMLVCTLNYVLHEYARHRMCAGS